MRMKKLVPWIAVVGLVLVVVGIVLALNRGKPAPAPDFVAMRGEALLAMKSTAGYVGVADYIEQHFQAAADAAEATVKGWPPEEKVGLPQYLDSIMLRLVTQAVADQRQDVIEFFKGVRAPRPG